MADPGTTNTRPLSHLLQCCFLLLLCYRLVHVLLEPNMFKVNIEHLGNMLQVRVVADDHGYVAVQLPVALSDEQVKQAVIHLANKDSHAFALGPVGHLEGRKRWSSWGQVLWLAQTIAKDMGVGRSSHGVRLLL